jgi:hypothetical protein
MKFCAYEMRTSTEDIHSNVTSGILQYLSVEGLGCFWEGRAGLLAE